MRSDRDDEQSPGSGSETPVNLAEVQADDALLDMLGGGAAGRSDADAELARVLVAWRRDVDTEPIGELVDTDTALLALSLTAPPPQPAWHVALVWLLTLLAGVGVWAVAFTLLYWVLG